MNSVKLTQGIQEDLKETSPESSEDLPHAGPQPQQTVCREQNPVNSNAKVVQLS